jgi:hypothetical protein
MQATEPRPRHHSNQPLSPACFLTLVPKRHHPIIATTYHEQPTRPPVRLTSKPQEATSARRFSRPGDSGRYSALLYSEYFCAAHGADALSGWSAILEHNPPWIAYLPLSPTLHAVSCRHRALLLFLLLLYCYYKSKALSIPFGLLQQRSQDSGKPHGTRRLLESLLLGYT